MQVQKRPKRPCSDTAQRHTIRTINARLHQPIVGLRQLRIGFINDEILERLGSRPRRIVIAGVPKAQVIQDLADHVIIFDKGDHAHPALAPGADQGIHFVDFLDQLGPALAAGKRSGGFCNRRHGFVAAGLFALSPALVTVIPVIAHHLLAAV